MGAPGGTGSVLTFEPARVGRLFRSGRSGRGRAPAGGAVPAGGVYRRAAKSCGGQVGPVLAGGVIPCARGARPCALRGADPVPRRGPIPYPAGGPKTFSKKFLRTRSVSVYTSSRSSEAIRTAAWGVSSVWLERRPVTSEVAGSSPVLPAIANKALPCAGLFAIERACREGSIRLGRWLAHVDAPTDGAAVPDAVAASIPAATLRPALSRCPAPPSIASPIPPSIVCPQVPVCCPEG